MAFQYFPCVSEVCVKYALLQNTDEEEEKNSSEIVLFSFPSIKWNWITAHFKPLRFEKGAEIMESDFFLFKWHQNLVLLILNHTYLELFEV